MGAACFFSMRNGSGNIHKALKLHRIFRLLKGDIEGMRSPDVGQLQLCRLPAAAQCKIPAADLPPGGAVQMQRYRHPALAPQPQRQFPVCLDRKIEVFVARHGAPGDVGDIVDRPGLVVGGFLEDMGLGGPAALPDGETPGVHGRAGEVAAIAGVIAARRRQRPAVEPAAGHFGLGEPAVGPQGQPLGATLAAALGIVTLPNVFNQMAGGSIWGALFFLFMSFAALTTVIAVFENIISFAMDLWGWTRKKAVLVNGVLIALLSLPCALGFNVFSNFHPLGGTTTIQDLEDFLVSNNLLPLGSLVYLLFCVSRYGWGWDKFVAEADAGEGMRFPRKLRFYFTWILPFLVLAVFVVGYWDKFFKAA